MITYMCLDGILGGTTDPHRIKTTIKTKENKMEIIYSDGGRSKYFKGKNVGDSMTRMYKRWKKNDI